MRLIFLPAAHSQQAQPNKQNDSKQVELNKLDCTATHCQIPGSCMRTATIVSPIWFTRPKTTQLERTFLRLWTASFEKVASVPSDYRRSNSQSDGWWWDKESCQWGVQVSCCWHSPSFRCGWQAVFFLSLLSKCGVLFFSSLSLGRYAHGKEMKTGGSVLRVLFGNREIGKHRDSRGVEMVAQWWMRVKFLHRVVDLSGDAWWFDSNFFDLSDCNL